MGLLDPYFGNGWEDPKSQSIMAFATGLMRGDPAGAFEGANKAAVSGRQAQQEAAYKQLMAQNLQSEMEQRAVRAQQERAAAERQAAFDQQFYSMGGAPAGAPVAGGAAAPGGMPGADGAMPGGAAATPQAVAMSALQISQKYGIPVEAVLFDYRQNGGKGIPKMIEERSKPNWMNVNGHMVNPNTPGFQGGYMPDPTKGVTMGPGGSVQLMPGATQAQSALTIATEGPKALLNSAGRVNLRTMPDNSQAPVSELSENTDLQRLLGQFTGQQGQPGAQMQPRPMAPQSSIGPRIAPEVQRTADQEAIRMMQSELRNPNLPATHRAGIEREIARMSQAQAMPGFPAASSIQSPRIGPYGQTTAQTTQAAADKVRAEAQVKADVERQTGKAKKSDSANEMLGNIWRARVLLESDPTGSLAGAGVDKVLGAFGKSTPSAQNADRLESLSGWLVSNVPRMEGPQSNFDVDNYKTMAGRIGDRTYPVAGRLAALEEVERIQKRYAHLNSPESEQEGGATGSFDEPKPAANLPKPMKGMTRNGYRFKGGDPKDKANWEKM